MNQLLEWRFWSADQIVAELPDLISRVELNLESMPEEYQAKDRQAIEVLRTNPPSATDLRTSEPVYELMTLGHALDFLGQKRAEDGCADDALLLFQVAHEMFRGGRATPDTRAEIAMRQTLLNALGALIDDRMARVRRFETDAGTVHDEIFEFIKSVEQTVPTQIALTVNERLLVALERAREEGENDTAFHRRFVRENIEAVFALDLPVRLEEIRDRWRDVGEHVAPDAVRLARRTAQQPLKLGELVGASAWRDIEVALEQGSLSLMIAALAQIESELERNLHLRLRAKDEYREPASEMRYQGGPDRFFQEARELLERNDARALERLQNIMFRKPDQWIAKEWCAYARILFGRASDTYDIIRLLEEAIENQRYVLEFGWVARWNLACALRRFPDQAPRALDVLLPVLNLDFHLPDAFELCLHWALEQKRQPQLSRLLLASQHHEAHLLAALYDLRAEAATTNRELVAEHFRRINRIAHNPDHVFPAPEETLSEVSIDRLTREFIEQGLVAAGIEWFSQRLFNERDRAFYKNWEAAARLNEEVNDWDSAWRCRQAAWERTANSRYVDLNTKARALENLLKWAQRNGYHEEALVQLNRGWKRTSMPEATYRIWESRLQVTPSPPPPPPPIGPVKPPGDGHTSTPTLPQEPAPQSMSAADAELIIQEKALGFRAISSVDALAIKQDDASRLLDALGIKYPNLPPEAVKALRDIVRLAGDAHRGGDTPDPQILADQMTACLGSLQQRDRLPVETANFVDACIRVTQSFNNRLRMLPSVIITPPDGLKGQITLPGSEAYTTHLFVRLANPAPEEASNLTAALAIVSRGVRVTTPEIRLARLMPDEKQLVEFALEITPDAEDPVDLRVHLTYAMGSIRRNIHTAGHVPVVPQFAPVPAALRYVTASPVGVDRKDAFHGRERELREMSEAFSGGLLRKLYFVNGIRRVGKSSLMNHLGDRCQQLALPFLLNVETLLGGQDMDDTQFVRQLMRDMVRQLREMPGPPPVSVALPGVDAFQLDPPWVVFDDFVDTVRQQSSRQAILLCFDEMQRLVMRIADPQYSIREGFLAWLRGKIQNPSKTLVICTGSEPYELMRRRFDHTLWANMEAYNVSFVDLSALRKIAQQPVEHDGVTWLPEALDRLWVMTEGHPWVTQLLAERCVEHLNEEHRRVVGPGDVQAAAEDEAVDSRVHELWWNEKDGQVTAAHRQMAFLLLQNQPGPGQGVSEGALVEVCQKAGIRNIGRQLSEMRALEVLSVGENGGEPRWRIRGQFLERYLQRLQERELEQEGVVIRNIGDQKLALMLDWENAKICLKEWLQKKHPDKLDSLRLRLGGTELAKTLYQAARRHGDPRLRWAVADWDNPGFRGDQAGLKREVRFETDMSGENKENKSDHVLRERIHQVLRDSPEYGVYVVATGDADFSEVIHTLRGQGKAVILWSTRDSISRAYGFQRTGPDPLQIEWLEDIVFGDVTQGEESPAQLTRT